MQNSLNFHNGEISKQISLFNVTDIDCMLDNLPGSSGAADISSPDEPGKEDKTTCIIVTKATKTARMTGQPVPGETIPSPNNTPVNYNIGGTDLGIFWKMSDNKVGILFGDTYGKAWRPGHTPEWRSNAMAWNPQWVTNWSGFAVSEDDGNTWELHKNIFSSDSKFAQMALWKKMSTFIQ